MTYDSSLDTQKHIDRVREMLKLVEQKLSYRGFVHDYSKLHEPEKEAFDRLTPKLQALEYGSPEYKASLIELGEALQHHYRHNRHHPEFHAFDSDGVFRAEDLESGRAIRQMNLFDLIEMLVDWKAASERHDTGNIVASIDFNQKRFGYSDELKSILVRTAQDMGWLK